MSAISSGYVCGSVTATNQTIDYGRVTLVKQRLGTRGSVPGDSGGPIFIRETALGIVSGNIRFRRSNGGVNNDVIYSHIGEAKRQLGIPVRE
jgi:hypothetical protein